MNTGTIGRIRFADFSQPGRLWKALTTAVIIVGGAAGLGRWEGGLESKARIAKLESQQVTQSESHLQASRVDVRGKVLYWGWAGENWCGQVIPLAGNEVRLCVRQCSKALPQENWPVLFDGRGTLDYESAGRLRLKVTVNDLRSDTGHPKLKRLDALLDPIDAFWAPTVKYFHGDSDDFAKGEMILTAEPR